MSSNRLPGSAFPRWSRQEVIEIQAAALSGDAAALGRLKKIYKSARAQAKKGRFPDEAERQAYRDIVETLHFVSSGTVSEAYLELVRGVQVRVSSPAASPRQNTGEAFTEKPAARLPYRLTRFFVPEPGEAYFYEQYRRDSSTGAWTLSDLILARRIFQVESRGQKSVLVRSLETIWSRQDREVKRQEWVETRLDRSSARESRRRTFDRLEAALPKKIGEESAETLVTFPILAGRGGEDFTVVSQTETWRHRSGLYDPCLVLSHSEERRLYAPGIGWIEREAPRELWALASFQPVPWRMRRFPAERKDLGRLRRALEREFLSSGRRWVGIVFVGARPGSGWQGEALLSRRDGLDPRQVLYEWIRFEGIPGGARIALRWRSQEP